MSKSPSITCRCPFAMTLFTLAVALILGVAPSAAQPPTFSVTGVRGSSTPVLVRNSHYDYVPTVMLDGLYRAWWCGGIAGDHIFYSQSSSLSGSWATPQIVLAPSAGGGFDSGHVCDPSVIRVNGLYYMYYGANTVPEGYTKIGLATSADGINWTRANGGNAIFVPALHPSNTSGNTYGAGQPSAFYLDGYFYLAYTDTTGQASNPYNGAGIYVVRSTDPTFQSSAQVLTGNGTYTLGSENASFVTRTTLNATSYSYMEAFSIDWMHSDAIDGLVIAGHWAGGQTDFFVRKNVSIGTATRVNDFHFAVSGTWIDGPGLVRRPDGHARASSTCSVIPVDILRGVGNPADSSTWDLAWLGADLNTALSCANSRLERTLEGYLMASPGLPLALVVSGTRLQFALMAPSAYLSRNWISVTSEMFHLVPYGGSLYAAAQVYWTDGQPHAFEMDGPRLWPMSCAGIIAANNSSTQYMAPSVYGSIPKGPSLFCIQ